MWLAGTPTRVIAETLKTSADKCDAARRRLKLPKRAGWHNARAAGEYVPSPAEIRRKCLEIQATWSDEERARRLVGGTRSPPVEARVVSEATFTRHETSVEFSLEDLLDTSGD